MYGISNTYSSGEQHTRMIRMKGMYCFWEGGKSRYNSMPGLTLIVLPPRQCGWRDKARIICVALVNHGLDQRKTLCVYMAPCWHGRYGRGIECL